MNEFLWVEKYRPQTIAEIVLPSHIKATFEDIVSGGELHNMLLTGTAGLGKTTVAKALCNELDLDLNAQSTQPALRGFIEEFSSNCRFILTCNFKNRIIEPLHSRCSVIEFNMAKKDMPPLLSEFMKRVEYILDQEKITYDKQVIADLIMKHMPDWRRVLNELQRYSTSGNIDTGILVSISETSINDLMLHIKHKDFKRMRQWVADNMDTEPASIFRKIYDTMFEYIDPKSIPQLVLILADYQYKNAFVADHELNLVACLTEIMAGVEIV